MNLLRDNSIFHSNLVVEGPDGVKKYSDISHIYHGNLLGKYYQLLFGPIEVPKIYCKLFESN